MTVSLARGLTIILFFFATGVENLNFSFRSQYDGYIYPSWKEKTYMSERFYEDAVVVGKDFMVLGDGLGGTDGLSGIFSIHQCLNIAEKLATSKPYSTRLLSRFVKEASDESVSKLGLQDIQGKMGNVATTLVYLKLHGKILFSGVIGDSGFSIYRYFPNSRRMRLIRRSKEKVHEFNAPFNSSTYSYDEPDEYEDSVEVGDVVMVASDGVLDVIPSSFLTAATNFLIARMLQNLKDNVQLDDFDYDYDLADFLEKYVTNLNSLSLKLQEKLNKDLSEAKFRHSQSLPDIGINQEVISNPQTTQSPKSNNSQTNRSNLHPTNQQQMQPQKNYQQIENKDIFYQILENHNRVFASGKSSSEIEQKKIEIQRSKYSNPSDFKMQETYRSYRPQNQFEPNKNLYSSKISSNSQPKYSYLASLYQSMSHPMNIETELNPLYHDTSKYRPSYQRILGDETLSQASTKGSNQQSTTDSSSPKSNINSITDDLETFFGKDNYKRPTYSRQHHQRSNTHIQSIKPVVSQQTETERQKDTRVNDNQFTERPLKSRMSNAHRTGFKLVDRSKELDKIMNKIYRYEICNVFDPLDDASIFNNSPSGMFFRTLSSHNVKHKPLKHQNGIDCFRNKRIEKTTIRYKYPNKWACEDILDLSYPIHPIEGNYHNFHQCVHNAIPKLPKETTPEKIAKAFNSRYFARNIALAVKYLTNDPRVKVGDFLLKKYFNHKLNKVVFRAEEIMKDPYSWKAKEDDVSIAAAAITDKDMFHKVKDKEFEHTILSEDLSSHYTAIEEWFYKRVFGTSYKIVI